MIRMLLVFLTLAFVTGCPKKSSGPPSVKETSAARAALADRIKFVEGYVTFRRNYKSLEYDIMYQNNGGGMVPAPADWDVRLIAEVPEDELDSWIPADTKPSEGPAPGWLQSFPGTIEREGVQEWYKKAGTHVGINREKAIIIYRNTSTPDQ